MLLFDLHYHLNINCYRFSRVNRIIRLRKHQKHLEKAGLDFVASTEHAYKNPLEAYLYLKEISSKLDVTIIPGVEWITREGVEIIFLFKSENSLRHGLQYLKPFTGSVFDIEKLKFDLDAVSIIPHPFSPGKTGVASIMGNGVYFNLLDRADYVEIHNGLSLNFLAPKFIRNNKLIPAKTLRQIQYTFELPVQFKRSHVGWAVGSDAHFPNNQHIVGAVDSEPVEDWFSFLKDRQHFMPVSIHPVPNSQFINYYRLLKSGRCVWFESMTKKYRTNGGFRELSMRLIKKYSAA